VYLVEAGTDPEGLRGLAPQKYYFSYFYRDIYISIDLIIGRFGKINNIKKCLDFVI